MAIGYSPKIATDGLVFYYDTGNVLKSYKGEPTVNNINGGANVADCISGPLNYGAQGGVAVTATLEYYSEKRPHVFRIKSTNDTGYNMINQQSSIQNQSGGTYTYSYDFKQLRGSTQQDSSCTVYGNGYKSPTSTGYSSNVSIVNTPLEDGWTRRAITYTATYTGYNYYRFNLWTGGARADGAGDFEFLFDNFQIETNSHATPFTNNTRSATQGLLDLTGNSTIDLSNVSFDSNAQMTFDGTDDWLNIPVALNAGNFTYETVMQASNPSYQIFSAGSGVPPSGGTTIQAYVNSSGALINLYAPVGGSGWQYGSYNNQSGYVGASGAIRHIVVVNSNTNWKTYVNGVLVGDVTSFAPSVGNAVGVARSAMQAASTVSTTVYMLKVYNRALTASEVAQNFNAIKSRFGI